MTIREQWNNLSIREKQSLAIACLVIAIFCFYEIIWSPFSDKVTKLHSQVVQNRELLAWMQYADQRLASLSESGQKKSNASILSTMQIEIKKSPFEKNVTQLRQSENDAVQITLQKVAFDGLTRWITELWNTDGFVITQMTATPTGVPGEVTVDMIIKT